MGCLGYYKYVVMNLAKKSRNLHIFHSGIDSVFDTIWNKSINLEEVVGSRYRKIRILQMGI